MLLKNLQAIPDSRGNRINLSWDYPENVKCCGVLIFRSHMQYTAESVINQNALEILKSDKPVVLDSKEVGWYISDLSFIDDFRLKALEWYYYILIPCTDNSENKHNIDQTSNSLIFHYSQYGNRICAPATATFGASNQMYKLLPAIYHRYDANESFIDQPGPLQKFLRISGSQFDLLRSMSALMLQTKNIESTPGNLLPLLGNWIGWQPNQSNGYTFQRNEIRNAPEVYKTIGIVSNLKAMVNRITNCKAEVKEFANNVFITNEPACTTIWVQNRVNEEKEQFQQISCHSSPDSTLRSAVESGTDRLRTWIFFHTNYKLSDSNEIGTRIEYKLLSGSDWTHSYRIESDAIFNKFPAAVPFCNGMLLFWSRKKRDENWRISTLLISRGEDQSPAIVRNSPHEKYVLIDSDTLIIVVNGEETVISFSDGDFSEKSGKIITALPEEIARHINRQLPEVNVETSDTGAIIIKTIKTGSAASIEIKSASALHVIDFAEGIYRGADVRCARLIGNPCNLHILPNSLTDTVLSIRVDNFLPQMVNFQINYFENARNRLSKNEIPNYLDAIVLQINSQCKGVCASVLNGNSIVLQSNTIGSDSFLSIDYANSTAAGVLGFPPEINFENCDNDQLEPSATLDDKNNVWLAFSRRSGFKTDIVSYTLSKDSTAWQWKEKTPILTHSCSSDREPFICLQKDSGNSVLWCLWSRRLTISIENDTQSIWKTFFCKMKTGENESWSAAEALNHNEEDINHIEQRYPWAGYDLNGKFCIHTVQSNGNWSIVERTSENFKEEKILKLSRFSLASSLYIQHENMFLYRSSEPLTLKSFLYSPSSTMDHRWCGSTTIVPDNHERIFEMETLNDTMRYTYETVDNSEIDLNNKWYSFNTIGIYLTPYKSELMQKMQVRIKELVEELRFRCLPIQLRLVFIFNPYIYNEYLEDDGNTIHDDFDDIVTGTTYEQYRGIYSNIEDSVPEWTLFHSKDNNELPQSKTGDVNDRTWHPWVKNRKRKS